MQKTYIHLELRDEKLFTFKLSLRKTKKRFEKVFNNRLRSELYL